MRELTEIEKEFIRNDTDDFDRKFDDRKKYFMDLGYDEPEAEEFAWYYFCCQSMQDLFNLFCKFMEKPMIKFLEDRYDYRTFASIEDIMDDPYEHEYVIDDQTP